jgi:heat shock protein HslJ
MPETRNRHRLAPVVMMTIALVLSTCGPATQPPAASQPPPAPLEGVVWRLEAIVPEESEAMTVDPWPASTAYWDGGQVRGRTACNYYGTGYEINGEALSTEVLEVTLQACPGRQGEQEAAFLAALGAVESFRIDGDQLLLTYPGGQLQFGVQPDPSGDENAVYAALLREWDLGAGPYIIHGTTAYNAPEISLDETLAAVEDQIRPAGPIDPQVLADFREKNAPPHALKDVLALPVPVTFVSQTEIDALREADGAVDWGLFNEQYPGADRIYTLSRVGFNAAGDQALVYLGLLSAGDSGDFYSWLELDDGLWVATRSFRLSD